MIWVEISKDAQADLNEGFLFYEAQEPDLGDYVIACFNPSIARWLARRAGVAVQSERRRAQTRSGSW